MLDNSSLSVAITGTAKEGATLTATPPTIGDSDDTGATVSYQWQSSTDGSSWSNISGAAASTYVLAEGGRLSRPAFDGMAERADLLIAQQPGYFCNLETILAKVLARETKPQLV